jgi:hypothetical protein
MNHSSPSFSVVVTRMLRDAHGWIQSLWECRIPLLFVMLFCAILNMGQMAEFLDQFLLVCGSHNAACSPHGGIQGTTPQLAFFFGTVFILGSLVRMVCRENLNAVGRRSLSGLRKWMPVSLGLVPIFATSYALLNNVSYTNNGATVGMALVCATMLVGLPGLAREAVGPLYHAMVSGAGLVVLSLCVASGPASTGLALAGSVAAVFACVGSLWCIAARLGVPRLWFLLLGAPLGTAVAVPFLGNILAAAYIGEHAPFWAMFCTLAAPGLFLHGLPTARKAVGRWRTSASRDARRVYAGGRRVLIRFFPSHAPDTLLLGILALVPTFVLLFWMAADPAGASRILVAPTSVTIVLIAVLLVWSLAAWTLSRMMRWVLIVAVIGTGAFSGLPTAPLAVSEVQFPQTDCVEGNLTCDMDVRIRNRYREWDVRHGHSEDAPVVLVAAAGGGSRAAAHTVATLAAVDAVTCGAFGDRIFAISGVSGGAVGATLYTASRHDLGKIDRVKCLRQPAEERGYAQVSALVSVATGDHLSAIVNRALTRDLAMALFARPVREDTPESLDYASRGGMLETSWAASYSDYLRRQAQGKPVDNALLDQKAALDPAQPLMIYNATSVQDGQRVILSRPMLCPPDGWCAQAGGFLTDATDSARFPFVSPARARNVFHWDPYQPQVTVSERAIVDGGYFDNSGVTALLDVIRALKRDGVKPSRIVAVLVSSNPEEGKERPIVLDYANPGWLSQIAAPIQTITAVREGRSAAALHQLNEELGRCDVIYWPMSTRTNNPLTIEMRRGMQTIPEMDAIRRVHGRPSEIQSLERAPALGWALSPRSASEMMGVAVRHALPYATESFGFSSDLRLAARLDYPGAERAAERARALSAQECGMAPPVVH